MERNLKMKIQNFIIASRLSLSKRMLLQTGWKGYFIRKTANKMKEKLKKQQPLTDLFSVQS